MSKRQTTYYPKEAIGRIRKVLNKSKGMVLDDNLLNTVENICQGVDTNLKRKKTGTAKLSRKSVTEDESKTLEEQIQEERKIFGNIMEVIGAGLCLLDKDSKVVWANDTLREWLDLKESPIGNHCSNIYHCDVAGTDKCPAVRVFRGEEGHLLESWVTTTKTKKRMYIQHIAIPMTNKEGVLENILLLTVDVTKSEKLVQRLLLLQQFGEITQGTLHLDKLLHLILTCITADYSFGFNRAMLFLIDRKSTRLNSSH